jgi:hypothetical protein
MMSQPVLRLWAREWLLGRRSLIMHTILCWSCDCRELVVLLDAERAKSLSGPCCMGLVLIVVAAYLDDVRSPIAGEYKHARIRSLVRCPKVPFFKSLESYDVTLRGMELTVSYVPRDAL